MPLENAGRDLIALALVGEAFTAYDNTHAYLGVGDSTDAFDAVDTDLQAASNKLRVGMQPTYPQRTGNAITLRSLFSTSQANWAWQEWGVFNAASGPTMLNRKVESLGTKTSAQSWQLTITLTVTAA